MATVDTLLNARWVIPVEPDEVLLEHHTLALAGGRIQALLPSAEAAIRYPGVATVDLPTHALIPGLVNAHTHAAMALLRGLADDLPLMTWLQEHIWPAEARWVSADFVRDGSLLAMAEMLRGGTTCFNDMYFFPEVVAEAATRAHIRACVGLIVIEVPTSWANNPDEYLAKGERLHHNLHHPLIRTVLAPHAPYTVSDDSFRKIRTLAEKLDLPIHLHVHETAHEVAESVQRHGRRPLTRLDDLGIVSPRLLAVHMTQLTEGEIQRVADSGTRVLHCPESNLKLASGFCPVAALERAGVTVALGTDGAASNNDLDMFGEMRSAALIGKAVAGDPAALPAHQVLRMATLHGAEALGLGEHIGSLVPGKWADCVAVDLDSPETEPLYHPLSQLVYAAGRHQVSDVWVGGRRVLENRRLSTLDLDNLRAEVAIWQDRLDETKAAAGGQ